MKHVGFTVRCIDCTAEIHCHRVIRDVCDDCFRKNCIHEWSLSGPVGSRVCRKCLGFEDPRRPNYLMRKRS